MTKNNDNSGRLETLEHLVGSVRNRSVADYDFKRAVGSIVEDLEYVIEALKCDPDLWCLNRAFHVVHVPSLVTVVAMLEDVDVMTSVSEEERHQINSSLHRAASLVTEARHKLEQSQFRETSVELDVLAGYAATPEVPFEKASFFTRALDGVSSATGSTWEGAKSSAAALPGVVGRIKVGASTSIADRAGSVPLLATNLQKTLTGAIADNVTNPIGMRLKASSKALQHGVGGGVALVSSLAFCVRRCCL